MVTKEKSSHLLTKINGIAKLFDIKITVSKTNIMVSVKQPEHKHLHRDRPLNKYNSFPIWQKLLQKVTMWNWNKINDCSSQKQHSKRNKHSKNIKEYQYWEVETIAMHIRPIALKMWTLNKRDEKNLVAYEIWSCHLK